MSSNPEFRSVMRGYDPAQVNATIGELTAALEAARSEAADRTAELARAQSSYAELSDQVPSSSAPVSQPAEEPEQAGASVPSPSYPDLGERIGRILELADAEAQDMRAAADQYAEDVRTRADADTAQIIEDARRQADAHLNDAERAAALRRHEAEGLFEGQRAKAASAAAELEVTLNAQLAHVRQMLATLSDAALAQPVAAVEGDEPPSAAGDLGDPAAHQNGQAPSEAGESSTADESAHLEPVDEPFDVVHGESQLEPDAAESDNVMEHQDQDAHVR